VQLVVRKHNIAVHRHRIATKHLYLFYKIKKSIASFVGRNIYRFRKQTAMVEILHTSDITFS